jgi:hypothetical protein
MCTAIRSQNLKSRLQGVPEHPNHSSNNTWNSKPLLANGTSNAEHGNLSRDAYRTAALQHPFFQGAGVHLESSQCSAVAGQGPAQQPVAAAKSSAKQSASALHKKACVLVLVGILFWT